VLTILREAAKVFLYAWFALGVGGGAWLTVEGVRCWIAERGESSPRVIG
jgi:hypothetical protein